MINDTLSQAVIGCAMEVHRRLGPGFLETVYRNALAIELKRAGIQAVVECRIPVVYRDAVVGEFVADVIVEGSLILELKAVQDLHPAHEAQLVNYLQATERGVGLLLNFGASRLGVKRKHKVFQARKNPANPVHPINPVKNASAFTLLELLVSITVLSLLIVLLLSMVDNATRMWRQSENRVDAYREARAALNVISNDLASVFISTNTNFFAVDGPPTGVTVPNPMSDQLSGQLFFITALPTGAQGDDEKSDLCTVGYFAAFDSTSLTGRGVESMNLYRYFLGSNKTFEALKAGNLIEPGAIETDPQVGSEVLAKNITGFEIKAYTIEASTNAAPTIKAFSQSIDTPVPDILEIKLTAISNEAAKRLASPTDWTSTNSPVIRNAARTFTKRVVLNRDGTAPTP